MNKMCMVDSISLDCWNPKGVIRDKERKGRLNSDINISGYSLRVPLKAF